MCCQFVSGTFRKGGSAMYCAVLEIFDLDFQNSNSFEFRFSRDFESWFEFRIFLTFCSIKILRSKQYIFGRSLKNVIFR